MYIENSRTAFIILRSFCLKSNILRKVNELSSPCLQTAATPPPLNPGLTSTFSSGAPVTRPILSSASPASATSSGTPAERGKKKQPLSLFLPPRRENKTRDSDSAKDDKVPGFVESGGVRGRNRKVLSTAAQSVPDFSSVLRKENRRPGREIAFTPPPTKKGIVGMGKGLSAKGSKSASAVEKRGGGVVAARKSYANLVELRGSSVRAANDIYSRVGESRRRILGSGRL